MKVHYTPRAFADLDNIRNYISQYNPEAARRVVALIEKIALRLGDFPEFGTANGRRKCARHLCAALSISHLLSDSLWRDSDPSHSPHRAKTDPERHAVTTNPSIRLRPYAAADEDAAIELWRRTWQQHYPHIDFGKRVGWWRERWRKELVPGARIVVAEAGGAIAGFVTIDPKTMYLDQFVVAPEHWGSGIALALVEEAKRLSPRGIELLVNKDNARAIAFYEKQGFAYAGEDKNPVSGIAVNRMAWRA